MVNESGHYMEAFL